MVKKEFRYRGLTLEELKQLDIKDVVKYLPARERRSLTRGIDHAQEVILRDIKKGKTNIKTKSRDMIVLPVMVGSTIDIYNGKAWVKVLIEPEMISHRLGEFAQTREKVQHSAPGIGATRSSAALSVK